MKVLVKGSFSPYSGYGNDLIGITKALIRMGADVFIHPTLVDPPLPPEIAALLTRTLETPFDLMIHHVDPGALGISPQARRSSAVTVAWSMWESSSLDNLNNRGTLRERMQNYDIFLGYDDVTTTAFEPFCKANRKYAQVTQATLQGGFWPEDWKYVERDWHGDRFGFFMLGQLAQRKDPFVAIQAFQELKQDHPEEFEGAELHLKNNIPTLHPQLADTCPKLRIHYDVWPVDVVRQFYGLQHCILAPSRGEGKNMPALEFLSTGGSAIVTNWGGHALALSTPLPTPSGWTTMGSVGVGSVLLDDLGKPCVVTAKSDVLYEDTYRVTFSDNTDVIASGGHLWQVSLEGQAPSVLTTADLASKISSLRTKPKLPTAPLLDLPAIENLRVDPYVLGLWLADGDSDMGRVTVGREDLEETRKQLSQFGEVLSETYVKTGWGEGFKLSVGGLKVALRELGVLGSKHIPTHYLRSGTEQRLQLLRGLMDGDGTVSAAGQCFFDNTNRRLLDNVAELARSLSIKVTQSRVGYTGNRRLSFYTDLVVFTLPRKVKRQEDYGKVSTRSKTRVIRSIEPVLTVPTQCVTVNSASSLYLCGEGMVPTHNTQWVSSEYAYPLDFVLRPVEKNLPNCFQARASKDHLKELMLHVYRNRDEARRKGEIASQVIPRLSSWDNVVERMIQRVADRLPGKGEALRAKALSCRLERQRYSGERS